jgi:hypothetical protein
VLRYTGDLFYAIWKEALTAKKNVLKGSARLTGSGPIASATNLEAEMIAVVQADARGKIAKAAQKLHDKTTQRCTEAVTPIGQLFRGACGTSSSLDGLGDCAEATGGAAHSSSRSVPMRSRSTAISATTARATCRANRPSCASTC